MKRPTPSVAEDVKQQAFELVQAALPRGWRAERHPELEKPSHLFVRFVTGDKARDWSVDLHRQTVTAEMLEGIKRSAAHEKAGVPA